METVGSLRWKRPASRELSPNVLRSEFETDADDLLPRIPYRIFPPLSNSRKRSFEDEGIGNSSDTPLFSSDDHPASAENYFEHHSKRQRKGPWWVCQSEIQEPIIRKKSKREFRRNVDSGVWMGSDPDMEDGREDFIMEDQTEPGALSSLGKTMLEDPENFDGPVFPYWDVQPASEKAFWRVQRAAAQQVNKCIDHGAEIVDLSVSLLDPKWERFEPFIPDLQLYLANNSLSQLPGQLFKLHDLTVLSLRHNNLEEIPSAIGNLVNLRELNVSYNKLRWLPYEIHQLLQRNLKTWRFHPNPFVEPVPDPTNHVLPSSTTCSTRPAFFRIDGTLARDSLPSPTTAPNCSLGPDRPIQNDQSHLDHPHRSPSLFETSLRYSSAPPSPEASTSKTATFVSQVIVTCLCTGYAYFEFGGGRDKIKKLLGMGQVEQLRHDLVVYMFAAQQRQQAQFPDAKPIPWNFHTNLEGQSGQHSGVSSSPSSGTPNTGGPESNQTKSLDDMLRKMAEKEQTEALRKEAKYQASIIKPNPNSHDATEALAARWLDPGKKAANKLWWDKLPSKERYKNWERSFKRTTMGFDGPLRPKIKIV
ncbi:MAG: hypothetical protein Q9213_000751 [Squamulea squamosa]